jgi:hypothetical protein
MVTDNFCFYLQNRLIQTSQTGCQPYSDNPPLVSLARPTSRVYMSLWVRSHMRFGSSDFAERCDFNRNPPIFSYHHRWRQRQHVMFSRLCKHHFKGVCENGEKSVFFPNQENVILKNIWQP